MRAEYSASKRRWLLIILLQMLSAGLAVWMIGEEDCPRLVVLGAIAMFIPPISIYLRAGAVSHYGLAERLRKVIVLKDGLGIQPSLGDLLEIESDATILKGADPQPLGTYYDSPVRPGIRRIFHITQEAAFYTRKVAQLASWVCATWCVIGVAAAVVLLLVFVQSLTCGPAPFAPNQVARIVVVLLAYFSGGLFADLWVGYRSLMIAAERTFQACDRLRNVRTISQVEIYKVLGAYDSAVAAAAPLPGFIYWISRNRLNQAWARSMGRSRKQHGKPGSQGR